ncbi:uncharacterized protein OCT59_029195 [Rhizophagus irregularis]|nr:hypothetical protein OCT59_029195 [Rhizophagus irregularis]
MLLWLRLFSIVAINIFIFGNIFKKIIPFFAFLFFLIFAFSDTMYSLGDLVKQKLVDEKQDNDTFNLSSIWEYTLYMYYLNTASFSDFKDIDSWQIKLFFLVANIILVLVLMNMIIALMNDTFNKAKEDSNLGILMYRKELIDDFEKLDIPYNKLYDSPYICYLQDPQLMKKWMEKSKELGKIKLYSLFEESVDKENITYDKDNMASWYELILSNKNQKSTLSTSDHMTLWF